MRQKPSVPPTRVNVQNQRGGTADAPRDALVLGKFAGPGSPDREICANFETDIAFPKGSWHEPLRAVRA